VALQLLLRWQAQPASLRAGGDDHAAREVDVARVAHQPERLAGRARRCQIGLHDQVVEDAGADMLCLLGHLLHQPGALDRAGEARVVLHVRGDHELATWLQARNQDRLEVGARRVDGCRIASGACADHQDIGRDRFSHDVASDSVPVLVTSTDA